LRFLRLFACPVQFRRTYFTGAAIKPAPPVINIVLFLIISTIILLYLNSFIGFHVCFRFSLDVFLEPFAGNKLWPQRTSTIFFAALPPPYSFGRGLSVLKNLTASTIFTMRGKAGRW